LKKSYFSISLVSFLDWDQVSALLENGGHPLLLHATTISRSPFPYLNLSRLQALQIESQLDFAVSESYLLLSKCEN